MPFSFYRRIQLTTIQTLTPTLKGWGHQLFPNKWTVLKGGGAFIVGGIFKALQFNEESIYTTRQCEELKKDSSQLQILSIVMIISSIAMRIFKENFYRKCSISVLGYLGMFLLGDSIFNSFALNKKYQDLLEEKRIERCRDICSKEDFKEKFKTKTLKTFKEEIANEIKKERVINLEDPVKETTVYRKWALQSWEKNHFKPFHSCYFRNSLYILGEEGGVHMIEEENGELPLKQHQKDFLYCPLVCSEFNSEEELKQKIFSVVSENEQIEISDHKQTYRNKNGFFEALLFPKPREYRIFVHEKKTVYEIRNIKNLESFFLICNSLFDRNYELDNSGLKCIE